MNLTIDVGNTNIFLCFFVKNKVYTSEIINNKDFSEKKNISICFKMSRYL